MQDAGLSADLIVQAKAVITANRRKGKKIAVAESCTGGLVSAALTEIAGSSDVFEAGFITYGNEAKRKMLGVNAEVLETFGAVSIATAWAMAQGALERSGCDVAVAITGIAGPGGGSEKKPVGTVVFARARRGEDPETIIADTRYFAENSGRSDIRRQAALCALELLMPDASPFGEP
ncbi:CinA family protein [Aquisediminimonas sediminicola]|uniref:CinA family protein n=1 Tax=Alteraquisediminimonas sediminicola TaxID=2676787 RepID=UPI001C8EBBD6|nr:CinA family protein [Aquisediminimonas sediminicola]